MSFPVRERGLKHHLDDHIVKRVPVVPRAGTWIETPYVGSVELKDILSFPVRERGLKPPPLCPGLSCTRRSPCGNVD